MILMRCYYYHWGRHFCRAEDTIPVLITKLIAGELLSSFLPLQGKILRRQGSKCKDPYGYHCEQILITSSFGSTEIGRKEKGREENESRDREISPSLDKEKSEER